MKILMMILCIFTTCVIASEVPLTVDKHGGKFVQVRLNDTVTLPFKVDSGADDIQISKDVGLTLFRAGTISKADQLPSERYSLADGTIVLYERMVLHRLEVGDKVLINVPVSVGTTESSLLLGQGFFKHTDKWSIDNKRNVLILDDSLGRTPQWIDFIIYAFMGVAWGIIIYLTLSLSRAASRSH
ncbi:retroviral-like aspartic protease family protein [Candidatus Dojkabacteria bacterium]|jgi:hypothetical protein|nr:retroviral-like aspartic protease family protein [Candidatus Dojkabacteria bacterium]